MREQKYWKLLAVYILDILARVLTAFFFLTISQDIFGLSSADIKENDHLDYLYAICQTVLAFLVFIFLLPVFLSLPWVNWYRH